MKLKPYPQYKDSGVPWLGEIPIHWDVIRNGYLFQEVVDTNHPDLDLLSIMMDRGIILQSDSGRKTRASEDRSTYKRIQPGQLGYNLMNAFMGSVGISKYEGILSPAYAVGKPRLEMDSWYFHHLFRTPIYLEVFDSYSYGIMYERNRLYYERFKLIYSPFPPVEEQKAIGEYIKFISHKINRFIRNKRSLIKLLNEQKQVIINQAVTRGIDRHAPLKSSNIPHIGDVPKHWEIIALKRCFSSMEYGISESISSEGKIRVLTMGNIQNGQVNIPLSGGVNVVDESLLVENWDLLFNRTNSAELVGKVGLFFSEDEQPVTFASYLVRLRPKVDYDSLYLNYLLNSPSIREVAKQLAIPSLNQSNLNPTRYGRINIAIPNFEEQIQIRTFLDQKLSLFSSAITRANYEIDLMQEYRTRLISDVVTGKIDVRDIEIPALPDEDAVEELDDEELLDAAEAEPEAVEDADE